MSDFELILEPTKEEFSKFLDVFEKLASFEAQSRELRGIGCFSSEDKLPIPEVVCVLNWLNHHFINKIPE